MWKEITIRYSLPKEMTITILLKCTKDLNLPVLELILGLACVITVNLSNIQSGRKSVWSLSWKMLLKTLQTLGMIQRRPETLIDFTGESKCSALFCLGLLEQPQYMCELHGRWQWWRVEEISHKTMWSISLLKKLNTEGEKRNRLWAKWRSPV